MVTMFLGKPLLHCTKHTLNTKVSKLHDGMVLYLGVSIFIGIEKVGIGGYTMTISPKIQPIGGEQTPASAGCTTVRELQQVAKHGGAGDRFRRCSSRGEICRSCTREQRQQKGSTQALKRRPWATPKREEEDGDIPARRTLGGRGNMAVGPLRRMRLQIGVPQMWGRGERNEASSSFRVPIKDQLVNYFCVLNP